MQNLFGARETFSTASGSYLFYQLSRLEELGLTRLDRLPFSIRVMLELLLRQCDEHEITRQDVINLAAWTAAAGERPTMPFKPAAGDNARFHRRAGCG